MINKTANKRKSKKAISEIVSYVLLIVIALTIAGLVYSWLKFYIPSKNEIEKCSEDMGISVNDYSCNIDDEEIILLLENKGFFNVDGFFIRASNNTENFPVININSTFRDMAKLFGEGRYDFNVTGGFLAPQATREANFSYNDVRLGENPSVKRITLQPFIYSGNRKKIILCDKIIDIKISGCD
jgi:flagellin-like protein